MFRFASPLFFSILSVLAVCAWLRARKRFRPALGLSSAEGVKDIGSSIGLKIFNAVSVLKYVAFCLMVAAMARPQWGTQQMVVLTEGVSIVLAVDISGSMRAMDFQRGGKRIDRLEAVKGVVRDFIEKRTGDRIAMVVFGSNAYTQLPLTMDYKTIEYVLERLEIGAAGERTAIGDAIGISLKRLEDVESESNIIILLTDGRSNSGELTPEEASEIASQKGVKIYTVAVGTHGEAPFPVDHPMLGRQYVYQRVDMDEASLKAIAKKTDGQFFRASDVAGLEKIYDTIDKLEKTQAEIKVYANYQELYAYFLIPAFVLLCLWIVLTNTRFLGVP
jgi:Ca-activated chloride channel family protein